MSRLVATPEQILNQSVEDFERLCHLKEQFLFKDN